LINRFVKKNFFFKRKKLKQKLELKLEELASVNSNSDVSEIFLLTVRYFLNKMAPIIINTMKITPPTVPTIIATKSTKRN